MAAVRRGRGRPPKRQRTSTNAAPAAFFLPAQVGPVPMEVDNEEINNIKAQISQQNTVIQQVLRSQKEVADSVKNLSTMWAATKPSVSSSVPQNNFSTQSQRNLFSIGPQSAPLAC